MASDESGSETDLEFGAPSKTNKDIKMFLKMKPDYMYFFRKIHSTIY